MRFPLRDRDTKICRSFDDVFCLEGVEVLLTPVRAPRANAYAERWVRTVRADCLDWLLVVGRGHLEQVLRICASTTTSTARTGRWGSKRRIDLPGWPSSVRINRQGAST